MKRGEDQPKQDQPKQDQPKQDHQQANCQNRDDHKKRKKFYYIIGAAVYLVLCICMITRASGSTHTKDAPPETKETSKENRPLETYEAESDASQSIILTPAITKSDNNDITIDEERVTKFMETNYPEFEWSYQIIDGTVVYELWNEENQVKMTCQQEGHLMKVDHNGVKRDIYLEYSFNTTELHIWGTKFSFCDITGEGQKQLIISSYAEGTRGTTHRMLVYDLNTMKQIPIKEDTAYPESCMNIKPLNYYDNTLTYLFTVLNQETYLMSEYLGFDMQYVEEQLLADPFYADAWEKQISISKSLRWPNYETLEHGSGIKITYNITPGVFESNLYCGTLSTMYYYNGIEFVLDKDSVQLHLGQDNKTAITVAKSSEKLPNSKEADGVYKTWYLSQGNFGSVPLLIELMSENKEVPKVTDACFIKDRNSVSLKELKDNRSALSEALIGKQEIKVIWSCTPLSESTVINYTTEQSNPCYDNRSFFVYDRKEDKVVYHDSITFDLMSEAFLKQGRFLIAHPNDIWAQERFEATFVDEEDKLITVEYSFLDQDDLIRKGSFSYNYKTGEFCDLVKGYQELSDQFQRWDEEELGENYKKLIWDELNGKLCKQTKLDTEFLHHLSPNIQVNSYDGYAVISYSESQKLYGESGHGTWMILWQPERAQVIVSNETLTFEEIIKRNDLNFLIIVSNYQMSGNQGEEVIRIKFTEGELGIEAAKVAFTEVPEESFSIMNQYTLYAKDRAWIDYTVSDDAIVFRSEKGEYSIPFESMK